MAGSRTDGELPYDNNTLTMGQDFQNSGYITGCFGKWYNSEPNKPASNTGLLVSVKDDIIPDKEIYEYVSSVLNSEKAILVNIAIMRVFVFIRQYALNHKDLTDKLEELEKTFSMRFKDIYAAIDYLMEKDKGKTEHKNRKRIGFRQDDFNH